MVYNERMSVDSEFDAVADISAGKENVRIRVRVIRLWKVPSFLNPSESNSLEMVLIDAKGGKIHASVRKPLIYLFESKLEEGLVYELSQFLIFPQSGFYRTTLHPYKIVFQSKTNLKLTECNEISQTGLTFTDIDEICGHTRDYDYLIDVIGVMTGLSAEREYIRDGKVTKMVVMELTDHSGKCECALFGDYVDELNRKLGKSPNGLPIVVVQFAKIKIFRDKASIQNVISTTRIMINPDIAEVETFKDRVAVHGIEFDSSVAMIGESPKPTAEEEFLRMHPKKTVGELVQSSDGVVCVVYGEVVDVVQGQDWWYPACRCHKAVVPVSGSYFCNSCDKHVFQVIPRYRVKLVVTDGISTCVFVLFDSDMSYIMEKSCAFFVAQSKARSGGPHPVEFDGLVGMKMLFVVDGAVNAASVSDGTFRVKRVCTDPGIIESFCNQYLLPSLGKGVSNAIDLECDGDRESGDTLDSSELQASEFVDELIVTPAMSCGKEEAGVDIPVSVKRKTSKCLDRAGRGRSIGKLKKVKIEKD